MSISAKQGFHDWCQSLYYLVAIVGLVIAGCWTYNKYVAPPSYSSLVLKHRCESFSQADGRAYLRVYVDIENRGNRTCTIGGEGFFTQINDLYPSEKRLDEDLRKEEDCGFNWPGHAHCDGAFRLLGQGKIEDPKGPEEIKPNQTKTYLCHFMVPKGIRGVSVYSRLGQHKGIYSSHVIFNPNAVRPLAGHVEQSAVKPVRPVQSKDAVLDSSQELDQ